MFDWLRNFSLGVWAILGLAVVSSVYLVTRPPVPSTDHAFWVFARPHFQAYEPLIQEWNEKSPEMRIEPFLISLPAMERRLFSGFMSGTPMADLFEITQNVTARLISGPVDDIGLRDLTDLLASEGLSEAINPPSFSPWTLRGRIYGLPHDVHPVLLAYRSDLVEAAGIDVNEIETWEDFGRIMGPLQRTGGAGTEDRYLLNLWPTNTELLAVLMLQAGGGLFDVNLRPILDSEVNATVMATIATWCAGPKRIAIDAPEFSASGNALKMRGQVVAAIMPDWLAGVWKNDMPGLAGKLKLMPLPAWTKGGRRTSVMGGTMMGFNKNVPDETFNKQWKFAQFLYRSPELAAEMFRRSTIIPPDRNLWNLPVFNEPDAYFSGQPSGRLFIDQAPDVPLRVSSPFFNSANEQSGQAMLRLVEYANANGIYTIEGLLPKSRELLAVAQAQLKRQMERNVFMREDQ